MSKRKSEILEGINLDDIESSKFVGNNTLCLEYKDGTVAYRLHNTNVVTIKKNGDVILNTGGWWSATTKERINKYIPIDQSIAQRDFVWYINGEQYYDGISFNKDGDKIEDIKEYGR